MERKQRIQNAIEPFLPAGTAETIANQIVHYRCHLTITRDRKTKAGDYRHPYGKVGHRISVNGSLNRYAFLITLVHEIAHLVNWEKHKNRVNPHGKEWKQAFKDEMQQYLNSDVFPPDILAELKRHMKQPLSATVRDIDLMRVLRSYDESTDYILLEEIPEGAAFTLGKHQYIKGNKLRKRYRCEQMGTKRTYLISAIAEVKLS